MSMHKSLRSRNKDKRTVRTKRERLQKLIEDEKFKEGTSIFGLPKEKRIKYKLKKEKEEQKEEIKEVTYIPLAHKKTSKDVGKIK